ncbi:Os07g0557601, partial [Oryza sativa Japonica Group]
LQEHIEDYEAAEQQADDDTGAAAAEDGGGGGRAGGAGALELQRVDGERHVLLVRAAPRRRAAGRRRLGGARAVEHGAQHGGHGGDVHRLVLGQQPRQPHQLAVAPQHPPRPVAAGDLPAHVPLQLHHHKNTARKGRTFCRDWTQREQPA